MRVSCRCLVVLFFAILVTNPRPTQAQTPETSQPTLTLDAVTSSQALHDGIQIQAGGASVRITALRDDIIRVRIAPGAELPEDASWAVLSEPRSKSVEVKPAQDDSSVGFRTSAVEVRVERNPPRISFRDLQGNVICADSAGRPTHFQVGGFTVSKQMIG